MCHISLSTRERGVVLIHPCLVGLPVLHPVVADSDDLNRNRPAANDRSFSRLSKGKIWPEDTNRNDDTKREIKSSAYKACASVRGYNITTFYVVLS